MVWENKRHSIDSVVIGKPKACQNVVSTTTTALTNKMLALYTYLKLEHYVMCPGRKSKLLM